MIIEEIGFEANLIVSQNHDAKICKLRDKLEKSDHRLYEMRNGVIDRKCDDTILFYLPEKMEHYVMRK